jgi:hypothetical protein
MLTNNETILQPVGWSSIIGFVRDLIEKRVAILRCTDDTIMLIIQDDIIMARNLKLILVPLKKC